MAHALTSRGTRGALGSTRDLTDSTCALLTRARDGDSEALNQLFASQIGPLRQWATGRLPRWARDLADTQDLIQETTLHAFERLAHFRPNGNGSLQAYLRQALKNRIRNEFRRAARHPSGESISPDVPADRTSPLDAAIRGENRARYERALSRLSPRDGTLLRARLDFGFSYDELARLFQKPSANAARMATARVLLRLAAELKRD